MTTIRIHTELHYALQTTTSFGFQISAARSRRQAVVSESLVVTPDRPLASDTIGHPGHPLVRLVADPGPLWVTYDAEVSITAARPVRPPSIEHAYAALPVDVLQYLSPSRYCEVERLQRFAEREFGRLPPGFERVSGICNWVYDHLEYVAGSTDSTSTACDVLVQGAGVCRDYAHVAITFCRALGVPARYLSGYAVDLVPQDFHGFFEAYLGDDWYLFDATRMASLDGLVRIAVGRDAADAAFTTFIGLATLERTSISVSSIGPDLVGAPPDPISTA